MSRVPRTVVLYTDVLTNLVRTGLYAASPLVTELKFVLPEAVLHTIRDRSHCVAIEGAIADGSLRLVRVEQPDAFATYAELKDEMGKGEAECLALAANDAEWLLGSDQRRHFRRVAIQKIGTSRIVTTPGIILQIVRCGVLSIEEADQAKAILEAHHFPMAFASFRELLDGKGP